jgi:hypothetical protein
MGTDTNESGKLTVNYFLILLKKRMNRYLVKEQLKMLYVDYVSYLNVLKTIDRKHFKKDVLIKREIIINLIDYIENDGDLYDTYEYIKYDETTYSNSKSINWIKSDDYNRLIDHLRELYKAYSELYIYNLV